jgi:hypothetical protein
MYVSDSNIWVRYFFVMQAHSAYLIPHFWAGRQQAYSCWSTASGARVNNYGSRIDLILAADAPAAAPAPPTAAAPCADGRSAHAVGLPGGHCGVAGASERAAAGQAGREAEGGSADAPRSLREASGLAGAGLMPGQTDAPAAGRAADAAASGRGERAEPLPCQIDGLTGGGAADAGRCGDGAFAHAGPAAAAVGVNGRWAGAADEPRGRSAGGSGGFAGWFVGADVWADALGSDHAPVWADLELPAPLPRPPAPPSLSTRFMFTGEAQYCVLFATLSVVRRALAGLFVCEKGRTSERRALHPCESVVTLPYTPESVRPACRRA